jgi:hypothetical protein
MHVDFGALDLRSEGDVESKLLVPLITSELYLGIPGKCFFSKDYLAPTPIDKGKKAQGGYVPDFSVWMHSFPVLTIEAKAPGASVEQGYREAALYAQQRNMHYPSGVNPAQFIIASNGQRILLGRWDSNPEIDVEISQLRAGGRELEEIITKFGKQALEAFANDCLSRVRTEGAERAFSRSGGQALLNAKKPLNSFAAELSPILRRYFSSTGSDVREIIEKAYVSSTEITEYGRVLESLLKDRASTKKDTIVQRLEITRNREVNVERVISSFAAERPKDGQLQIIQGPVGAGKSLFIRRYQQMLQNEKIKSESRWAWVDFNSGPPDLTNAQTWLCEAFIKSFQEENQELDMSDIDVLKGIFSRQIQRRKPIYDEVSKSNSESAARMRGDDLIKWQDDPIELTRGIGNYVMGVRHEEVLIVVMDNVDRLDLKSQLAAFQLALWFMGQTRSFVILQMRDETYERFKNQPPLDTFRTGIAFHISPPRFIDVVKRRLDLSIGYLAANAASTQAYELPSGIRMSIPTTDLGMFLRELYVDIFERRRNISGILESLAGLDVRRALDMFVSVITSGHLGEDQITSQVRGAGGVKITEHNILKILMRTDYRFFSDHSGFVSNIFTLESEWKKPSNFLFGEILFHLAINRNIVGELGVEGYFSIERICDKLQLIGFHPDDTLDACNTLLKRYLIHADHMNTISVEPHNCIKLTASGFAHMRIMSERIEYLYGILPSTRIADSATVDVIVDVVRRESTTGDVSVNSKVIAVRHFYEYLVRQAETMAAQSGREYTEENRMTGTEYLLRQIHNTLLVFNSYGKYDVIVESNALD